MKKKEKEERSDNGEISSKEAKEKSENKQVLLNSHHHHKHKQNHTHSAIWFLADSFCRLNPLPKEKFGRLFRLCPPVEASSGNTKKFASQLVNERSREAVEATSYVINSPQGKVYIPEVVPLFLKYLNLFPQINIEENEKELKADAVGFSRAVVVQLIKVATENYQTQEILSEIINVYTAVSNNSDSVWFEGISEALAEVPLPLNKQQLDAFVKKWKSSFNEIPTKQEVMIVKVMSQFISLPESVCSIEASYFFLEIATRLLKMKRSKSTIKAHASLNAIHLLSCCGSNRLALTKQVVDSLRENLLAFIEPGNIYDELSLEDFTATCNGLIQIGQTLPQRSSYILDSLIEGLFRKCIHSYRIPQYTILLDGIIIIFCKILKFQNTEDISLVNSVFSQLKTTFYLSHQRYVENFGQVGIDAEKRTRSNTATQRRISTPFTRSRVTSISGASFVKDSPQVTNDSLQQTESLLITIVTLMGKVTCYLNDPKVTELILGVLLRSFHYPPEVVDSLIIEQLREICKLGHPGTVDAIIEEFTNIFKRILKETSSVSNLSIPDAIFDISKSLNDKSTRENLLQKIMKLFRGLGKDTPPEERNLSSPLLQGMGYLLPIITELMQGITDEQIFQPNPETDEAKSFRSVWFYCVLFKFVERERWRSDWFACVKRIAHKMPVLIAKKVYNFKQMELELDTLCKGTFTEKDSTVLAKQLLEFLPNTNNFIKNLSLPHLLYILSVYYLESLRASSGTYRTIFAYLEDPSVLSDDFIGLFKGIADKVFEIYIDYLKSFPSREERGKILEEETIYILIKCCSVSVSAREVASSAIVSLSKQFPPILWNKQVIQTLLDLVDTMNRSCSLSSIGSIKVPNSGVILQLLDDIPDRYKMLKDLSEMATALLKSATSIAPDHTYAIIHEYMKQFKEFDLTHAGVSLAVEMCSMNELKSPKEPIQPLLIENKGSKFVKTFEQKAFYTGEVNGMIEAVQTFARNEEEKSQGIKRLEELFIRKFREMIENNKNGIEVDIETFNQCIYRSVAFLSTQPDISSELIHFVCWLPAMIFTQESLITGVNAWSWLLAARLDYNIVVMNEIFGAWSWTVEQKFGLFSNSPRSPSPLSITHKPSSSPSSRETNNALPHHIWIHFLFRRFDVIRDSSKEQLNIMAKILQVALSTQMSILPSSIITRYYFLLLCLRVLHSNFIQDNLMEVLLRERVYQAALSWFTLEPSWYNQNNRDKLLEDLKILNDFCRELMEEENAKNAKNKDLTPHYNQSGELEKSQAIHLIRDLEKTRKLILLLMSNEIDAVISWNNPIKQFKIPDELRFSIKFSNWKEFVKTAWAISPALAVHMLVRFPNSATLKKAIAKKIRHNPSRVLDVSEAVPLLVTEATVRENIPELKYLLYWVDVSPPIALSFLGKRYCAHPLVTQYAIRVLRSCPPETIIFYIPQLVQCLRYDSTGLVFDYLVTAAKSSELIAHQLLWNAQTYPKEVEKSILGTKCEELNKIIKEGMSKEEKQRFTDEFDFFDKVTNLSGFILEKAENKEARKPLLITELEKLKDSVKVGPLYLPTNPDIKVHGINPQDSTVLQSATKAPILVSFQCHYRDQETILSEPLTDDESKKRKKKKSKEQEKSVENKVLWKNSFKQACIFKVGDDVRQDMLAVQIIDLFKRIFENVELDLFLFPYKIIATKPGSGIIELVPNAISRDALGKKVEGTLFSYFQQKYGPVHSSAFQRVRTNFIQSLAAYSVVTFILQIKDRHNGNILIDEDGHIIHIDFGFMFESSPGRNMRFEMSPFKMSEEMIEILGGGDEREPFKQFMELGVKAFLAARRYSFAIMTLVELLLDTELPCFTARPGVMEHLQDRFVPEKTEQQASKHMTEVIIHAYAFLSKTTTHLYDVIQKVTQGISYN